MIFINYNVLNIELISIIDAIFLKVSLGQKVTK